jgi:hypothetical protein
MLWAALLNNKMLLNEDIANLKERTLKVSKSKQEKEMIHTESENLRDRRTLEQREEKLKKALKDLGNGKNKIAASLAEKKIKGIPGDMEDCALALYGWKVFPKCEKVQVDGEEVVVKFAQGTISVPFNKPLQDFVTAFDDYKYHDLIIPELLEDA